MINSDILINGAHNQNQILMFFYNKNTGKLKWPRLFAEWLRRGYRIINVETFFYS